METATMNANGSGLDFPAVDYRNLTTLVIAGAFATLAFDLFGQTISPLMKDIVPTLGAKLAPVALANQSLGALTGLGSKFFSSTGLGHGLHLLTGMFFYPAAYMFAVRPVANRIPGMHWSVSSALYGVALWVFALYVMAHLVAGNPPFLNWGGITWVALWGHIAFAMTVGAVVELRKAHRS